MSIPRTFPELLATVLRGGDPGQPLVTAYDDATGERTELSGTTYANWVAKTANLFVEELDLEAGDTVLLELPPHWLVPVFLGAAWSAGVAVTTDPGTPHAAVVCGPDAVAAHAGGPVPVVACALLPFAVRSPEPLPAGVEDYGVLWPGQSDGFFPLTPPTPDTLAWHGGGDALSQAEVIERAAAITYELGVRLLTDEHPARDAGCPVFLAPLLRGGSLVLLRSPRGSTWPARHEDERATTELRAGQPPSW